MKKILLSICVALIATTGYADNRPPRHRPPSNGKHRPPRHRPPNVRPRPPHHRPPVVRPRPPRHRPPVYRPPVYRPPVVVVPPIYYPQPHYTARFITCGSYNYNSNICYTGLRNIRRIDVLRQYSQTPCIFGQTFGIQGNAIHVNRGCSAEFRVEGY